MRKFLSALVLLISASAHAQLASWTFGLRVDQQTAPPSNFSAGQVGLWSPIAGATANHPVWRIVGSGDTDLFFPPSVGNTIAGSCAGCSWKWKSAVVGSKDFFLFDSNDAPVPGWTQGASVIANGFGEVRPDKVLTFGWNDSANGSTPGYSQLSFTFEDHYKPGVGIAPQNEFHADFSDDAGVSLRWLSFNGPATGGLTLVGLHANTVELGNGNGLGANIGVQINNLQTTVEDPTTNTNKILLANTQGSLVAGAATYVFTSTQFTFPSGSAATPIISFGSHPTTGFWDNAGSLGFSTNATNKLTLDTSGNMLLINAHAGAGYCDAAGSICYIPHYPDGTHQSLYGAHVVPSADNTWDLGDDGSHGFTLRWKNLPLAGNLTVLGNLGFYGTSAVGQQTASGASGYASVGGVPVLSNDTFTGGVGATAYTIGDLVKSLKAYGLISN
jgi:hypothetical protein